MQALEVTEDAKAEAAKKTVIRHAYRMRETMMIHSQPIVILWGQKNCPKTNTTHC
ncbi:MAG TPA: hypothetical protein PLY87_14390 [Planctomycetaceae bacterium]|nr:hypothetical protein [Planctomycetaceae bacterium]